MPPTLPLLCNKTPARQISAAQRICNLQQDLGKLVNV
jgi:hypothetical protein